MRHTLLAEVAEAHDRGEPGDPAGWAKFRGFDMEDLIGFALALLEGYLNEISSKEIDADPEAAKTLVQSALCNAFASGYETALAITAEDGMPPREPEWEVSEPMIDRVRKAVLGKPWSEVEGMAAGAGLRFVRVRAGEPEWSEADWWVLHAEVDGGDVVKAIRRPRRAA